MATLPGDGRPKEHALGIRARAGLRRGTRRTQCRRRVLPQLVEFSLLRGRDNPRHCTSPPRPCRASRSVNNVKWVGGHPHGDHVSNVWNVQTARRDISAHESTVVGAEKGLKRGGAGLGIVRLHEGRRGTYLRGDRPVNRPHSSAGLLHASPHPGPLAHIQCHVQPPCGRCVTAEHDRL